MKFFPLHINKISHRLTIVYALLFFVALVLVNAGTLISINYYMDQTSKQQLEIINQAIKSEVKTVEDIQQIDLKQISQMTDNVDIYIYSDGENIYKTGENHNIPFTTGPNARRSNIRQRMV